MKYSVCLSSVFMGEPLADAVKRAASIGFNSYEFWTWWDQDLVAVSEAQHLCGSDPVAMCTRFVSLTDSACRAEYIDGLKESIRAARLLGCPTLISQVGQAVSQLSRDAQHESIVEGLRACVPLLEYADIDLVIEPLNTRVDHPGYYLSSSDEGFDIVREVGSPRVKLLFDVYHQQIMEGDLLSRLRANVDLIGHIHIAGNPGRHEPYERSEVCYQEVVRALLEAGYNGAVGLEYFPLLTPDESLKRFIQTMPALNG